MAYLESDVLGWDEVKMERAPMKLIAYLHKWDAWMLACFAAAVVMLTLAVVILSGHGSRKAPVATVAHEYRLVLDPSYEERSPDWLRVYRVEEKDGDEWHHVMLGDKEEMERALHNLETYETTDEVIQTVTVGHVPK